MYVMDVWYASGAMYALALYLPHVCMRVCMYAQCMLNGSYVCTYRHMEIYMEARWAWRLAVETGKAMEKQGGTPGSNKGQLNLKKTWKCFYGKMGYKRIEVAVHWKIQVMDMIYGKGMPFSRYFHTMHFQAFPSGPGGRSAPYIGHEAGASLCLAVPWATTLGILDGCDGFRWFQK